MDRHVAADGSEFFVDRLTLRASWRRPVQLPSSSDGSPSTQISPHSLQDLHFALREAQTQRDLARTIVAAEEHIDWAPVLEKWAEFRAVEPTAHGSTTRLEKPVARCASVEADVVGALYSSGALFGKLLLSCWPVSQNDPLSGEVKEECVLIARSMMRGPLSRFIATSITPLLNIVRGVLAVTVDGRGDGARACGGIFGLVWKELCDRDDVKAWSHRLVEPVVSCVKGLGARATPLAAAEALEVSLSDAALVAALPAAVAAVLRAVHSDVDLACGPGEGRVAVRVLVLSGPVLEALYEASREEAVRSTATARVLGSLADLALAAAVGSTAPEFYTPANEDAVALLEAGITRLDSLLVGSRGPVELLSGRVSGAHAVMRASEVALLVKAVHAHAGAVAGLMDPALVARCSRAATSTGYGSELVDSLVVVPLPAVSAAASAASAVRDDSARVGALQDLEVAIADTAELLAEAEAGSGYTAARLPLATDRLYSLTRTLAARLQRDGGDGSPGPRASLARAQLIEDLSRLERKCRLAKQSEILKRMADGEAAKKKLDVSREALFTSFTGEKNSAIFDSVISRIHSPRSTRK